MKGSLSAGQYVGQDNEVHVDVYDELSGTRFLRFTLTTKDFLLVIMGRGNVPIEFDLMAEHVGQIVEHKEEVVRFPIKRDNITPSQADINLALAPYRRAGWFARDGDIGNHHRVVQYRKTFVEYRVTFYRYVDPEKKGGKA